MSTVVGLVQVNWAQERHGSQDGHSNEGFDAISFHVLPYSVGILRSYAQRYLTSPESFRWLPLLHDRVRVSDAADRLDGADVVGFSVYIWNVEISLAIAAEVKRRNPGCLVVFGGPQVPDRAEPFLRDNRFVDVACHGEGEAVFTSILEKSATREWSGIPAVSYLDGAGGFVTRPKAGRTTDLTQIPSPYLTGVFDDLIAAHPRARWMMAWETNRGCPFSCTFCDWGSATASRVYSFDLDRLRDELSWVAANGIGVIFCCDANFGMLPRDLEIAQMVIDSYKATGFPYTLSVQNAKNSTERSYQIQKLLADNMQTTGVTLSLQTTDPGTLKNIRRANIRSESYRELQRRFNRDGTYTYTDVIIALPGETYEGFADSVARIIADGQQNHIEFYNCSVLPNAEMGDPAYIEEFGLRTVRQAIRSVYSPADWEPDVEEYLPIVVTTDAMASEDWIRTKVFAWMTDLLYYDRLLQIPLVVLHERLGVSYRALVEAIADADPSLFPTLATCRRRLVDHARAIQSGGTEFVRGGPGGDIMWPADQSVYISLVAEGRLDDFYRETGWILTEVAAVESGGDLDEVVITEEALSLNRALLRLPGDGRDGHLVLSHDVLALWRNARCGEPTNLTEAMTVYRIAGAARSWTSVPEWANFLTWCHRHNKREYLHDVARVGSPQRSPVAAG